MVVGLHLESQIEVVVERDDAGIVDEGGAQPPRVELLGHFAQGGQQAVVFGHRDGAVRRRVGEFDPGPEGLVDTVL